ncbi:uncharacterized protein BX664DRAFT_384662, partial [Halteromyces radiatus]|uniref:uncharacterized protein n=1 Tax=Halteromyces radiatus TaxID=101107 RepID=UPI00221F6198
MNAHSLWFQCHPLNEKHTRQLDLLQSLYVIDIRGSDPVDGDKVVQSSKNEKAIKIAKWGSESGAKKKPVFLLLYTSTHWMDAQPEEVDRLQQIQLDEKRLDQLDMRLNQLDRYAIGQQNGGLVSVHYLFIFFLNKLIFFFSLC